MTRTVRRAASNAGWLALLGLLCAAAAVLVAGAPRIANRYTDQGLREWVSSLPYLARDVSYLTTVDTSVPGVRPAAAEAALGGLRQSLDPALRNRLAGGWYASQARGTAAGPDLQRLADEISMSMFVFGLRDQSGAEEAVRIVAGEWPRNPEVTQGRVRAAVSTAVADIFGLQVGSTMDISDPTGTLPVEIVGVFEPEDRDDPMWAEEPEVFDPTAPLASDPPVPWSGVLLTDTRGLSLAAGELKEIEMSWRFRLDEAAMTAADLPAVTDAVNAARYQSVVPAATVTTLDSSLARFAARAESARALLAIVQAGVAATLFGLAVLAAVASNQRRRGELALLRSRGSSLPRLGARLLGESVPVVVLAVAAGYLLGDRVPGRPGGAAWLAVVFGVAAVLIAPALAMLGHRRVSVTGGRADLARPRVSPRRLVAELTLVVVAVVGALLLRRRGLGTNVDIYLVALPVLVAAAAAVAALRVLPYPLRLVAAGAARARGAVPFLGLARSGRSAPATAGPVAVLVVAVSVGTFCAAVSGSVSAARDRVAHLAVLGDAFVQGGRFTWSAVDELAAVPGVSAVAAMTIAHNQLLGGGWITVAEKGVSVVVVDGPALEEVLRTTGSSEHVPDVLVTATAGDGPAPAVVSPDIAAALAGGRTGTPTGDGGAGLEPGGITVQGRTVSFMVAAVAQTFPGLGVGNDRFVALPLQAVSGVDRLYPNSFAVAGPEADPGDLAAAGDTAQRAWLREVLGRPFGGALSQPTRVRTYTQARADLERGGVDRVLGFTFVTGLAAGLLLALLAVGFAVATGARARGQALSRLRTMGLAPGQGRRLLAYELLPLILLGALVGSAVGAALPVLLGPALGLSAFSDGGEVVFSLDARVPGFAFALVLAGVVLAMAVEASMNRRARLGEVLRVGEGP